MTEVNKKQDEEIQYNLQNSFYKMVKSSFDKVTRFDELMITMEERLFNDEVIDALSANPTELLSFYNMLEKKKQTNQYFALKVLDVANKNALLMKLINNIIDSNRQGRKTSGQVDPKVQTVVNLVRQAGLNNIYDIE